MHNSVKKTASAAAQKLKGKAQKAIGEYQMESGEVWKGGISKAKGELNEKIADAKLAMEKGKMKSKVDPDDHDDEIVI